MSVIASKINVRSPEFIANRDRMLGMVSELRERTAKVAAGGLVVSCSCSGLVSEGDFLGVLSRAALDLPRALGWRPEVLHLNDKNKETRTTLDDMAAALDGAQQATVSSSS